MEVKRSNIVLSPNNKRVLFRPFEPDDKGRILKIVARIMELSDEEVDRRVGEVLREFHSRHQRLKQFFLRRFEAVRPFLLTDRELPENRRMLIGSYFTQEYALEATALFNPSIVWHYDQSNVPPGAKRFIMSLRSTGEGHVSSIGFRSGIVHADGSVEIDPASRYVTAPDVVPNALYEKKLFQQKLLELGIANGFVELVLAILDDHFTLAELERAIQFVLRQHRVHHSEWEGLAKSVVSLAKANYEIQHEPETDISERVIFPYAPTELNGIEDARFVLFTEDDGTRTYYATYTAFDGNVTFPHILETNDFLRFRIATLNGPEAKNKGMALFPRRINGLYAMLSRQDGENLYLMYSDMLHFWYTKEIVAKPTYPWEYVQIGNCGSPIETEHGWLVLTHGVGPMRKYSIGALLLDLENPRRVIGRLKQPLLAPIESEREGYVPNVVYSCGGLVHNGKLILPYAVSDYATTFATVELDELIAALKNGG
ncbi:MAG: glycosidase [Planctomycetota bacterium]|nr:MAG: glycosidase [Planctomycetota bacterium]